MDNQQERLHFNKGYILGVIDSDGCYQMARDRKKYYYPLIVITNFESGLIDICHQVLDELEISHWIWSPKKHGKEKRNPRRLYIKGLKRFVNFYHKVGKYNHAKKDRADLLYEFCMMRLSTPYNNVGNKPLSGEEEEFKRKLSFLNQQNKGAISPETIRLTT